MKRPSRCDVRADGKIFHAINSRDGAEIWKTPEEWHRVNVGRACTSARARAKKKLVPFDIDNEFLLSIYPTNNRCPVFNVELSWGGDRVNSPSLDRIHPCLGYVRGNVVWVSDHANLLKNSNSLDTLKRLVAFYEDILKGPNG